MNPLHNRLASLRRAHRLVILFRGLNWLAAMLLAGASLACLIDWFLPLPSSFRAFLLAGLVTAGALVGFLCLIRPLLAPADDLTLALRVEECYPGLNDCLASTVQFLQERPEKLAGDSEPMRQEAIRRALVRARKCDFKKAVDTRALGGSVRALEAACALALPLLVLFPAFAAIALERLTDPFGNHGWTRLRLAAPTVIAEGRPFELQGDLAGVVPDEATITFVFEDGLPYDQGFKIVPGDTPRSGSFEARLENVPRHFKFQVRANDVLTDWQDVRVLPPPQLDPASLQVRLHYPDYTDLLPFDLPPGRMDAEAVEGTRVELHAQLDRPVKQVWLEYRWEPHVRDAAAALAGNAPGLAHAGGLAGLAGACTAIWERTPVAIGPDGRTLAVTFRPWSSGRYELHFHDDNGLSNSYPFYLTLQPDPAPRVAMECRSARLDPQSFQDDTRRIFVIDVLPEARLSLRAAAADQQEELRFGVRSVYLEYRLADQPGVGRLNLHDTATLEKALGHLTAGLSGRPFAVPVPVHVRPQWVMIDGERNLAVSTLRQLLPQRRPLRKGDVFFLQACADDFDDVAVDKEPGRSLEVLKIRIVGAEDMEAIVNQAQSRIQKDLQFLRDEQRSASQKTAEAERHLNPQPENKPREAELPLTAALGSAAEAAAQAADRNRQNAQGQRELAQAEQGQQRVREQLGNPEEMRQQSLRNDVRRLLDTLRENQLQGTGAFERLETLEGELERRLPPGRLRQIEADLANARKQNEAGAQKQPEQLKNDPLAQARRDQQKVEKALDDLLGLMEPGAALRESKNEARALLEEQRRVRRELDQLKSKDMVGKALDELTPEQRAELEALEGAQRRLQEQMQRWQEKTENAARDNAGKDAETSKALREAAEMARQAGLTGQMKEARDLIGQNQLSQATEKQGQNIEPKLQDLVKTLEEKREAELDRLRKKLAELDKQLKDLRQQQDELRKKAREAAKMADADKREEELKRLARQQQALQRKEQQLQEELQQLSRKRGERAAQATGQAGASMEGAARRLERGENPDEEQQEALDRLQEARREVQRQMAAVQEELEREQLEKNADLIKGLRERQQGLVAEGERLRQQVAQEKHWARGLLASLGDLGQNQKDLGQETEHLAADKLAGARVVARALRGAGKAMDDAGQRYAVQLDRVANDPGDQTADAKAERLQREALRRLDQILSVLKPGPGMGKAGGGGGGGGEGGGGEGGEGGEGKGGIGRGPGESIPDLIQLKLLRAMQAEVNERTEEFQRAHTDLALLTDDEKNELRELRQQQQEIADLLEDLIHPGEPEGGKP